MKAKNIKYSVAAMKILLVAIFSSSNKKLPM
jgi:hypothetical protein